MEIRAKVTKVISWQLILFIIVSMDLMAVIWSYRIKTNKFIYNCVLLKLCCLQKNIQSLQCYKKMYWKEVNGVRKQKEGIEMRVKDKTGKILLEEQKVLKRWSEHFDQLLNVSDEREAQVNAVGLEAREQRVEQPKELEEKELRHAISRLKLDKSPGLDGVTAELLKAGGEIVVKWTTRLTRLCMKEGKVPREWQEACEVPLYKGKGCKTECKSFRGISLLSVPRKVYGRVVIDRVIKRTEWRMGEEQRVFVKEEGVWIKHLPCGR